MRGQPGFFDIDERLKRLSDLGDQLETFAGAVDFEIFRADLVRALAYSDGSQGGRPPFDPVFASSFGPVVFLAHCSRCWSFRRPTAFRMNGASS